MSNMRKLRLACILVMGLMAFGFALVAAYADTTRERYPLDRVAFDECKGEDIHMFGMVNLVESTTVDNRGGVHLSFHVNWSDMKAVGLTSGNRYTAHAAVTEREFTAPGGAPAVFTFEESVGFQILGREDNERFKFLIHVTVNPDGTVTSDIDNEVVINCG